MAFPPPLSVSLLLAQSREFCPLPSVLRAPHPLRLEREDCPCNVSKQISCCSITSGSKTCCRVTGSPFLVLFAKETDALRLSVFRRGGGRQRVLLFRLEAILFRTIRAKCLTNAKDSRAPPLSNGAAAVPLIRKSSRQCTFNH